MVVQPVLKDQLKKRKQKHTYSIAEYCGIVDIRVEPPQILVRLGLDAWP